MHTSKSARAVLAAMTAAALLAACGGSNGGGNTAQSAAASGSAGGIVGDYGGDQCLYDKLSFTNNGRVYMTVFGTDQAGQYHIDGDRIVVTAGGQSPVFTRNGSNLEANLLGERMVCAPLSAGADGTQVYEAATAEGRITLELGAAGRARITLIGAPGSDLPERASFDVGYESRGDSVTVEMPGEEPLQLTRNGRDLVSTMNGETVRFVAR